MALTADRVKETTTTTGLSDFVLLGAESQFQSFATAGLTGSPCWYGAFHATLSEWEIGSGTVTAGTLARTTPKQTSTGGAKVSFSAGTKYVFATLAADGVAVLSTAGFIQAANMPALTGDVTTSAGAVATAIGANKVLDAMIRQGAATSIIGRSANSLGNVADIAASADSQFLSRQAGALGFTAIVAADVPNLPASKITTLQLALARGGTNADLSATGGANQFLKQSSSGAAITVGALVAADIPSLDAAKITSGLLALARGGTNADLSATGGAGFVLKQVSSGAAITVAALVSGDLPSHTHAFSDILTGTSTGVLTRTPALGTLSINANGIGAPFNAGTVTIAASGTHARISGLELAPLTVSGSGAAVTNAQTLYLTGPGTGGTTNRSLYIASGNSYLGDKIFVGPGISASSVPNALISAQGTCTSASANANAFDLEPIFPSGVTNNGYGLYVFNQTQAAAFTLTSMYGVAVDTATKGAGSTVTTNYGIRVFDQTAGTTNYALHTGTGFVRLGAGLIYNRATVTYSASMTPDASAAYLHVISASNATAFTINAPTNPQTNGILRIQIRNATAGALGVATWNAVFKMSAWTQPGTATSRAIEFMYDGTNWVEMDRTTVDVPN